MKQKYGRKKKTLVLARLDKVNQGYCFRLRKKLNKTRNTNSNFLIFFWYKKKSSYFILIFFIKKNKGQKERLFDFNKIK